MDLETLVNQLDAAGRIKPTRLRDIRSSAARYARMLGCSSTHSCPEKAYALSRHARHEIIERELRDASPHVLRNLKNNLSFILRQGEELEFIRPAREEGEKIAPKQFGRRIIGNRFPSLILAEGVGYHRDTYSLPLGQWPAKLKQQYDDWKRWVTEAEVPRHYPNPRNRPATVENKTNKYEAFFGYLSKIRGIQELDFEMITDLEPHPPLQKSISKLRRYRKHPDIGLLEEFVIWHRAHHLDKGSAQAREVVSTAGSVARRYYFLRAALAGQHEDAGRFYFLAKEISRLRVALDKSLEEEQPERMISTEPRRVSRDELLRAAHAEFPQPNRQSGRGSGTELAARAGRAVAIMLLIYHPLRNRYYREAQLGKELVKKENRQWYLRVNADEGGKMGGLAKREFREEHVSSEVISYLEQYLDYWRPKLVRKIEDQVEQLKAQGGRHAEQIKGLEKYKDRLFLNSRGGPFTRAGFGRWIQSATYKWLGVRVNPELIRLIALER